ncbi:hypothetical protein CCACVL1_11557 [Corchorus capsularis]|uniref:Uncharacterized protein n=1 Tax=Corchorus capsularis TaxID=210143 RepID=A0A1R3IKM2_COCAP|nr:hypothetical protein CCACVL1_11557 [Corchorus capsularis]
MGEMDEICSSPKYWAWLDPLKDELKKQSRFGSKSASGRPAHIFSPISLSSSGRLI